MIKNRRGNVLLVAFIMTTGLAITVGSLALLAASGIKSSAFALNRARSFYLAEAGRQKALWYLITPTQQNGKGISWRTSGTSESFGDGSYTIRVSNGPLANTILITAEGTYRGTTRRIQAVYQRYCAALDYAASCQNTLWLYNNATVNGSLYVDSNVFLWWDWQMNNGQVIVAPPHTIYKYGSGSLTQGPVPVPPPSFPQLNTAYYDEQLALAAGSSHYDRTLSGTPGSSPIYASRNITISGTLNGPLLVVAGNNITVSDGSVIGNDVTLACGNSLSLGSGNQGQVVQLKNQCILYAGYQIQTHNLIATSEATLLSPGSVQVGDNNHLCGINGIINAGSFYLGDNVVFTGCLLSGRSGDCYLNGSTVTRDFAQVPDPLPPGLESIISLVKGSWKEL